MTEPLSKQDVLLAIAGAAVLFEGRIEKFLEVSGELLDRYTAQISLEERISPPREE